MQIYSGRTNSSYFHISRFGSFSCCLWRSLRRSQQRQLIPPEMTYLCRALESTVSSIPFAVGRIKLCSVTNLYQSWKYSSTCNGPCMCSQLPVRKGRSVAIFFHVLIPICCLASFQVTILQAHLLCNLTLVTSAMKTKMSYSSDKFVPLDRNTRNHNSNFRDFRRHSMWPVLPKSYRYLHLCREFKILPSATLVSLPAFCATDVVSDFAHC